ncbi:MAG: IS3 family transposase [Burkholderiales bacterium]
MVEFINQTSLVTRIQAKLEIFDCIETWYNPQMIHSKPGYLTPNEFEILNMNLPITKIKK